MASRHALVVGSQCDALPNQRLSFLPERAELLYAALIDTRLGDCDPAASSLVLDPTLEEFRRAVKAAVAGAAEAQATLVFAFIGHADTLQGGASQPLYLLPKNGDPTDLDDDSAYEIGHRLGRMKMLPNLDGLILLLDTCHAGAGIKDVIRNSLDLSARVRLELVAGTYLREARNGCFSESLIELMENGRPDLSVDYLKADHVVRAAIAACRTIQDPPLHFGYGVENGSSDPGLWVSRNVASPVHWPLSGTAEGALAVSLTETFQPTHDLERVVNALSSQRLVVVLGGEGSGKSALMAALARPELVADLPRRYLSAVAFTSLAPSLAEVAASLSTQLVGIKGFPEALAEHTNGFTPEELDYQSNLQRRVFGPLRHLKVPVAKRIRLAIDGIDQLEPEARHELLATVWEVCRDNQLERVSIAVTARHWEGPELFDGAEELGVETILLTRPRIDEVAEYLERRKLPDARAVYFTSNSFTWRELRLLADVPPAPGEEFLREGAGHDDLYQRLLASLPHPDRDDAKIVLMVLASVGSGPFLRIQMAMLLCGLFGGPDNPARFRQVLAGLGNAVTRAHPGTSDECIGLIDQTLVDYIKERDDWPVAFRTVAGEAKAMLKRLHAQSMQYIRDVR